MRQKRTIMILILVLFIGIIGLTVAYFSNSTSLDNIFQTKPYGTTVEEIFNSPSNWLPGDITKKEITATNNGEVDEAVRISFTESWTPYNTSATLNGWIHQDGTKSSHTTESELANDERVAVIDFDNDNDWDYEDGYYYYKYKITPGESTSSLIKSVTFNSKTKLDDTCTTTEGNGTKTITCNSSGSDYDHATYTLTFTVETVQYDKYAEAWQLPSNTTIAIGGSKPQGVNFAQAIMSKSNAASITNYTDGVTTEAYTFNHEATAQTPALTDYRYIGASPNNYVEFNCDDNGENCEVWRAIGVFYVDDGNNNWEWRVKLVREKGFPTAMKWDAKYNQQYSSNFGKNDWPDADINLFLNGNYFNKSGDASTYGLKESARIMISDTKYYLGEARSEVYNSDTEEQIYKTGNDLYLGERSIKVYSSNSISWIGKIGLIYSSDYVYSYSDNVNQICFNEPYNCRISKNGNPDTGWIYKGNYLENSNDKYYTLLITVAADDSTTFNMVSSDGEVFVFGGYQGLDGAVRPTLYLSSSVKRSIDSPYKLSL